MKNLYYLPLLLLFITFFSCKNSTPSQKQTIERVRYNDPGAISDLGVGLWAWPLPVDYDKDGDYDLLVSCNDKPYNGVYFFENTQGDVKMPIFEKGVKISAGYQNIQPSFINGKTRYLAPAKEIIDIVKGTEKNIYHTEKIDSSLKKIRANQWKYCDYNGDNVLDLIVGIGDWTDYGWDNAFDKNGRWQNGPLHGYVYLIHNKGTNEKPRYGQPKKITAAGKAIDVYGMPSPNFADFDNDGDLDLLCGEFLDKFTYYKNIGTRSQPKYAAGITVIDKQNKPITMDLEMIMPSALDWDKDGDVDLIVGQEDGRVAFVENIGINKSGSPVFEQPRFFRQQADYLKFGALVTPFSYDWDNDGDEDLICGNTAGYIGFIENLGGASPKWAEPVYLKADGHVIHIQAGKNGSIQGPCEAKWGYTTLSVADWDQDGLADIMINSIWGKILWYRNIGTKSEPVLSAAQEVKVEWPDSAPKPPWFWWNPKDHNLVTQWRTTPYMIDWNKDGIIDLVMLDSEGYLSFFERTKENGRLKLLPPVHIFYDEHNKLLRLNDREAGHSGRRKFCFMDWNRDGKLDLMVNSRNINFLQQIKTENGQTYFKDMGEVYDIKLAGHSTSPTAIDWDKDGIQDLLIGAEDGHFYYLKNPY